MPGNRASSKRCRGEAIGSSPPRRRYPPRRRLAASVSAIRSLQAPPFIGRAEALSRLRRAWDLACSGKRTVVWVAGEPGIGKTTLIEHFVAGLGDVACARGQCVEQYGTGEPYLPVLEALAELCRSDSAVPALLRAVAPTWLLQLPWLSTAEERDALRRELAGVSPDRMLREMGELLDRYTERRPLLLVTEDLHWSDRATIQLIDYIARRRGSARLMWLASFRLAEVVALDHPLNPLRHELRLHGLCEEIVLDPFSESGGRRLRGGAVAVVRRRRSVRACVARAHRRRAAVRGVCDERRHRARVRKAVTTLLPRRNSREWRCRRIWRPSSIITSPSSENEQRALLSAAAVCGVEFRVSTISDALERDAAWVGQTCDELAREQLWLVAPRAEEGSDAPELPYSFRHALFRQVLYERTAPSARAQLHRKVGAALERERAAGVPVAAAELAMHFERGREPMTALRYYAEAAEAALLHLSPAECMTLTERGVDPSRSGAGGDRARRAGDHARDASRRIGRPRAWRQRPRSEERLPACVLAARRRPAASDARTRCCTGSGSCFVCAPSMPRRWPWRNEPRRSRPRRTIRSLLLAACTVHGEVDTAAGPTARRPRHGSSAGSLLAEPLDVAPGEIFVADPQVTLLGLLAIQLLHLGLVEQARARLQQAHARARQLGQPMARMVAIWFDALFEVRLGNAERVAALADEMQALVDEFALAQGRTACRWFRGWADARMGEPRDGYRRIREAYEENTRLGMLAGASEILGVCRGGARARRRLGCGPTRNSRKRSRSRTRTGSACICRSCS